MNSAAPLFFLCVPTARNIPFRAFVPYGIQLRETYISRACRSDTLMRLNAALRVRHATVGRTPRLSK